MKLNKKLSVALIVLMIALGAVGCGEKKNTSVTNGNEQQGHNLPKMSEEEIKKGLENGTIEHDTVK